MYSFKINYTCSIKYQHCVLKCSLHNYLEFKSKKLIIHFVDDFINMVSLRSKDKLNHWISYLLLLYLFSLVSNSAQIPDTNCATRTTVASLHHVIFLSVGQMLCSNFYFVKKQFHYDMKNASNSLWSCNYLMKC